jgi:hypothetical protein
MFLSGTILRQIAHATPALTRPARRRDLKKARFRLAFLRCLWRRSRQCCPEASPGGLARCSRFPDRMVRLGRRPLTTIHQAASAGAAATVTGRVPAERALMPARSVDLASVWAVHGETPPARPMRGRRDGQARMPAQDRGRASDCAWAVLGRGSPGGPVGYQRTAQQTPCDLRVTAGRALGRRSGELRVSAKESAQPAVSELTGSWNKPRTPAQERDKLRKSGG